jgi:hypothetical protein
MGQPLPLRCAAALVAHGPRVLLLPRAALSLDNVYTLSPIFASDGLRAQRSFSVAAHPASRFLQSSLQRRENLKTCLGQPREVAPVHRKQVRTRDRLLTAPGSGRRKKSEEIRSQGSFGS